MLKNYRGYLQTDGYSAYTMVVRESDGKISDVACWAHARRKFDDNNVVERLFRGIAVGRRNYLFVGSRDGGTTAARLYTIVQSAKRHNLALSPYLNDVLRRLPLLVEAGACLDGLLPDVWAREHPEHVLAERQEESRQARERRDRRRATRRAAVAAGT